MSKQFWWIAGGIGFAVLLLAGGGFVAYQISEKGKPYLGAIQSAASINNVPWPLLAAQLQQESNFDPTAVSSAGAIGIAQFEPATAAQFGIDPTDATQSINAQAQYMSQLYSQFGNWSTALAAYNWGPANVQNAINEYGDNWLQYAPEETQNYVSTITSNSGVA